MPEFKWATWAGRAEVDLTIASFFKEQVVLGYAERFVEGQVSILPLLCFMYIALFITLNLMIARGCY